jgi:fatty acid desaturase
VNFQTGRIGGLLCAGLQYQIEHHLFPGMSHVYYPEASKIVRAYCDRHGYPYRTLGWGEAVWKALLVFYRPKPVFRGVGVNPPPLTDRSAAR